MNGEEDLDTLGNRFILQLESYLLWTTSFDADAVNKQAFEPYTAKSVTKQLVDALNKIIK